MPELPEVEAARRLVENHCLGGVIVKAIVDNDAKVIDGVTPAALQEALTGKKIVSAHRKGKHMWLQLDSPPWPSFQFGMSGAIIVKGVKGPQYKSFKMNEEEEAFPTKYSKVHLQLDNGVEVAFVDKRRFARVRLLDDPSKVSPISELGLDAYLDLPSTVELIESLKSKKASVKALLIDQSFLAGIGNWVGDEVLYQSKIHPEQAANSLKEEEVTRLHTAIQEVLEKAVSVNADSDQFPRGWLFHHRWDRKLGLIDGNQIETISISGRHSAFVPNVQKYSGPELKGTRTRHAVEEEILKEGGAAVEAGTDENVDGATEATEEEVVDEVSAEKAGTSEPAKRGRGRPPKSKLESPVKPSPPTPGATASASPATPGAKKRGRPPKLKTGSAGGEGKSDVEEAGKDSPSEPKRGRGRPPKAKGDASKESVSKSLEEAPGKGSDEGEEDAEKSPVTPKRGRGRPPKAKTEATEELESAKKAKVEGGAPSPSGATPKRGRGRPPKAKAEDEDEGVVQTQGGEAAASTPTPKKRGRPPKAK